MSVVNLIGVAVKNNPAPFNSPYEFEITIESLENLQHDLEWKLTYVGSATSSEHDQELDSLLVGPVPAGINKFAFEANPPDRERIPDSEIVGVTVILLTGSYQDREFVRVGYYVNNEYTDEALVNEPPAKPLIEKIQRNILAEKPRVTRLNIKWDSEESAPAEFPPDQPDVDAEEADGDKYGLDEEDELEDEADGDADDGPAKMIDEDGDVEMGDGDGADADADADEDGAESEDIEGETEEDDYYEDDEDDEAAAAAESSGTQPAAAAKPADPSGTSKAAPAQQ